MTARTTGEARRTTVAALRAARCASIGSRRRRFSSVVSIAALLATARAGAETPLLTYDIQVASPAEERVTVHAVFENLPAGDPSLSLEMAERYAFVRLPEPLLDGPVRASLPDGTALAVENPTPYHWNVAWSREATKLVLDYSVRLRQRAAPEVVERQDGYEHPYIAADHGMLATGALIVGPARGGSRIRVRFALPAGWSLLCPWPEIEPGIYAPQDASELRNDLVAIGAWQTRELQLGSNQMTAACAPPQQALLATVAPLLQIIVAAENKLFGGAPRSRYLFLFGRADSPRLAGSPKSGSMTLNVPSGPESVSVGRLAHLVAHEYHHTWLHARFEPPDELRFYDEGFTDYYAFLVPARLGILPWTSFADELGAKMAGLEANPRRGKLTLPAAGGPIFFTDPAARDLVYQEGALLAAWLDRCIRRRDSNHSLDEFMRLFDNDARWHLGKETPKLEDFLAALAPFVPAETLQHLQRILAGTEPFDPASELRRTGIDVQRSEEAPPLDLPARLDSTTIRDLDPAGGAPRLGLRRGDTSRRVVFHVAADPWRWHLPTRDSTTNHGS